MSRRRFAHALGITFAAIALVSFAALAACATGFSPRIYSTVLQDNRPRAPFEIAPGLYSVGSSDISVFALDTSEGLILIGGGYESTAPQILANLRTLRFDPRDVRILLNTHAHMDHAGGFAELKRATGARLYASAEDALLLEAGGRGDFFLRNAMIYEPVSVDRRIADGDRVALGEASLTAHLSPGHTKGCTSWSFPIVVDEREVQALIVCSLSTLAYPLVDNSRYPDIVSNYQRTYRMLHALPCELFLSDHAKFFDLERKRRTLLAGTCSNPFIDPQACRAFIDREERFPRPPTSPALTPDPDRAPSLARRSEAQLREGERPVVQRHQCRAPPRRARFSTSDAAA